MNIESIIKNVYHKINLRKLKTEEEQQWEKVLHDKAIKSLSKNKNGLTSLDCSIYLKHILIKNIKHILKCRNWLKSK